MAAFFGYFPHACPGFHPPHRGVFLAEQREKEAERLTKEAAGLRREASLPKAELEARGEALRQVRTGVTRVIGVGVFVPLDSCVKQEGRCSPYG